MNRPLLVIGLFGAALLSACSSDPAPVGPVEARVFGRSLFSDSRLSTSQYNGSSCATCHADSPTPPAAVIYSGHTLVGATSRAAYWGGYERSLLDAVNFCYVQFMRGVEPLRADAPVAKALYEYLVEISPPGSSTAALPLTVVKNVLDVPRGDTSRGETIYRNACQTCHGSIGTGDGRSTELASIIPAVFADYDTLFPGVPKSLVVIEKVRHGQFFGVGGNMPLYAKERLSDADLGALLAFLGL